MSLPGKLNQQKILTDQSKNEGNLKSCFRKKEINIFCLTESNRNGFG